jgi:hypothetical protein
MPAARFGVPPIPAFATTKTAALPRDLRFDFNRSEELRRTKLAYPTSKVDWTHPK